MNTFVFTFYLMEVLVIAKEKEALVNNQIRAKEVLVIGPKGEQVGIKSISDAITFAGYAGFDLVQMSDGNPPVCKLMDYNKYKYEKKKKLKESQKKQRESNIELKEFRLSAVIDKHDFDTRVTNASKHLQKGNKIKASIRFKGRQLAHTDLGKDVLLRFAEALSEYGEIEEKPKLEGRSMYMTITSKK